MDVKLLGLRLFKIIFPPAALRSGHDGPRMVLWGGGIWGCGTSRVHLWIRAYTGWVTDTHKSSVYVCDKAQRTKFNDTTRGSGKKRVNKEGRVIMGINVQGSRIIAILFANVESRLWKPIVMYIFYCVLLVFIWTKQSVISLSPARTGSACASC